MGLEGRLVVRAAFDDDVGGVVVWLRVQEPGEIGHEWRVREHVEEQRVVVEDVEVARVLAIDVCHPRLSLARALPLAAFLGDAQAGLQQTGYEVGREEPLDDEIAVRVKEEALGLCDVTGNRHHGEPPAAPAGADQAKQSSNAPSSYGTAWKSRDGATP